MNLKVVLLTRSWQPDAALMAWRLLRSGADVSVVLETRGRNFSNLKKAKKLIRFLLKAGFGYSAGLLVKYLRVRIQFLIRKRLKNKVSNPVYRSVEELALDEPVRIFKVNNQNDKAVRGILADLKPDAGIVIRARRPAAEILETAPLGFYGLHFGDLEKYSGADPIFWALAAGEPRITVTVRRFLVPRTCGITAEHSIRVFPFEGVQTLYAKALWYGSYLMARTLEEMAAGITGPSKALISPARTFSWPSAKTRRLQHRLQKTKKISVPDQPRVLHIITRMIRGGAQKNTLATARGLAQKGYGVMLITGPSWGNEDEVLREALEENLEVMILPGLVREISLFADILTVFKLRSILRRCSFAIVHTHTSKAGLLGRIAARWAKTPIVVHTPHGHVFHSYFPAWKEKVFLWMERLGARWTSKLVALTAQCRDEHLALGVGGREQWTVIPSGVDEKNIEDFSACRDEILDSLKIPRTRKIIGYIGRLAPVKGCFGLIRALLPVYWAKHDFHCLIVGDGEQRGELENMAAAVGLKGRVTFAGHQKDVSKFLSIVDVLAVPSLNEGMGRVIVEAGFLKKPVVATEVGGIPGLITSEATGLLVPPHHPDLLAAAIIYLLNNPSTAAGFGRNLYKKVLEEFTESQMIEKIHQLYQQLLTEQGKGRGYFFSGRPEKKYPLPFPSAPINQQLKTNAAK